MAERLSSVWHHLYSPSPLSLKFPSLFSRSNEFGRVAAASLLDFRANPGRRRTEPSRSSYRLPRQYPACSETYQSQRSPPSCSALNHDSSPPTPWHQICCVRRDFHWEPANVDLTSEQYSN